ncbi:DNA alkylation repair protein [Paenibacillus sp. WQ 127069]|uniref:DNA alkylation repair protein n=1 Tax=Paenibacillus baimaensis TaxID=2982185 RepID=A0ABT2UG98_9BACL|nr:DNA alkylation repair protein [Paenibacillus sp. WQ 127069]MCU6793649.1 DNA alkylation repair protein [Paenibacillus sp. WQ 127069]
MHSACVVEIVKRFKEQADADAAMPMIKYMRNQFAFLGLPNPVRTSITKPWLKEFERLTEEQLIQAVEELWDLPEREYQYAALSLLEKYKKSSGTGHVDLLEKIIINKSWWDTVDTIASHLVGAFFLRYPELISAYTERWIRSDNMWLQRTALLFQLTYKQQTDQERLFSYILLCKDSDQFFIRKAIGWSLRELSKSDPQAVISFMQQYTLSPLSHREALKVINRKQQSVSSQSIV